MQGLLPVAGLPQLAFDLKAGLPVGSHLYFVGY